MNTDTDSSDTANPRGWGRAPMTNDIRDFIDEDGNDCVAVELQTGEECVMYRPSWDALQAAGVHGRLHLDSRGVVKVWHSGTPRAVARLVAKLAGRRVGERRSVKFRDGDRLNLRLDNIEVLPGPVATPEQTVRRQGDVTKVWLQDGSWITFGTSVWTEWTRLGLPVPHVAVRADGSEMLLVRVPVEGGQRKAHAARLVLAIAGEPVPRGYGVRQLDGDVRNLRANNLAVAPNPAGKGRDAALIDGLRQNADRLAEIEASVAHLPDDIRPFELAWRLTCAHLIHPASPYSIAKYTGIDRPTCKLMQLQCNSFEDNGLNPAAIVTSWTLARDIGVPLLGDADD